MYIHTHKPWGTQTENVAAVAASLHFLSSDFTTFESRSSKPGPLFTHLTDSLTHTLAPKALWRWWLGLPRCASAVTKLLFFSLFSFLYLLFWGITHLNHSHTHFTLQTEHLALTSYLARSTAAAIANDPTAAAAAAISPPFGGWSCQANLNDFSPDQDDFLSSSYSYFFLHYSTIFGHPVLTTSPHHQQARVLGTIG